MTWRALLAALAFARVIAGEAPACDDPAVFVALAQVNANRQERGIVGGWFGDRDPDPVHVWAALNYSNLPDEARGAVFAMGTHDHPAFLEGSEPVRVFLCEDGQSVRLFR